MFMHILACICVHALQTPLCCFVLSQLQQFLTSVFPDPRRLMGEAVRGNDPKRALGLYDRMCDTGGPQINICDTVTYTIRMKVSLPSRHCQGL